MKKNIKTFMPKLPLVDIQMGEKEIKNLKNVIKSGWVTLGSQTQTFENMFSRFIGTKYAVATSSCTSALQIVLAEYELSRQDEVITTPFTWESTITAIIYAGATPVFADIDSETFNIDPNSIIKKVTKRTKGIVVVHYAGMPCNMDEIKQIAKAHKLFIIEDSAHALGSEYDNKKTGSLGDAACFSFGSTKVITTGEGGMITTNNERKFNRYKILRNYGETKSSLEKKGASRWTYDITLLSYNYKINEFAAAIGVEQMKKLPSIMSGRARALRMYQMYILKNSNIRYQKRSKDIKHIPLFYPISLKNTNKNTRTNIMTELERIDIETNIYYPLVYKLTIFKKLFQGMRINCPIAEDVSSTIFSVPCHRLVKKDHVLAINKVLHKYLKQSWLKHIGY